MHQYAIAARSKLENFAPRISLCAERGVLSIRNANIVSDGVPSELGILSFDLGIILGFACDFELFSCELQQTSKHRRLWRLAVATQPTIAGYFYQSAPCNT